MIRFTTAVSALSAALTFSAFAQAPDLPEGQGKAVVQAACSQCHAVDMIASQPRSRDEWTDVVSRMVGNGAQLSDDDYKAVIDYLATNLAPAALTTPAPAAAAAAAAAAASPPTHPPGATGKQHRPR